MFSTNPFAVLSATVPPSVMQTYVAVMILLVAGGTLFDILHKGSARYFFDHWRHAKGAGNRQVGGGEMAALAVRTALVEVATSAEFCNQQRRVAHLLTMYGLIVYVVTTVLLVFCYSTAAAPPVVTALWYIGALMICVGGYWFWFFIRADVASEGNSPFRIMRADLFILSLLASATFGLIWAYAQANGSAWSYVLLGLYLIATTVLFGSIPWSKFSHMFFKPAVAYQRRVELANGSTDLPLPSSQNFIVRS
jgi:hypothetical protein